MKQQPLFGLLSHTLNGRKGRLDGRLAAQAAMKSDAEAVSLVTNMLQQFECLRVAVNEKGIWISHTDNFFQPLGKADHGEFIRKTQFAQRLPCKLKLPFSTIDHYQLRKVVRGFRQHTGITAVYNLFH